MKNTASFPRSELYSKNYINCCISGCFFHLCQSWLKRLKKLKLYLVYLKDKDFSKAFKMCQALAYIPNLFPLKSDTDSHPTMNRFVGTNVIRLEQSLDYTRFEFLEAMRGLGSERTTG